MGQKIRKINYLLRQRVDLLLLAEILAGLIISVIFLLIFLKIGTEIAEDELINFDSYITNFIYSFRSEAMTSIMKSISFLASPTFLICVALVMTAYVFTKRKKDAVIYVSIIITGILLNLILKSFFQRPRPEYLPLIHENSFSFPSGHAMNGLVFYLVLTYFVFRETGNKKLSYFILFVSMNLILLIGISRIYLGVHYPTDVIAGYVAGFLWFVSAILFEKAIIYKRLRKNKNA